MDGPTTNTVVEITIPQLAFEHEFLLDTLLGVTSAHMQHLRPDVEVCYQTDFYRVKALSGFREALSQITSSNYEAIIVAGLLFVVLTLKGYGTAEYDGLCVVN